MNPKVLNGSSLPRHLYPGKDYCNPILLHPAFCKQTLSSSSFSAPACMELTVSGLLRAGHWTNQSRVLRTVFQDSDRRSRLSCRSYGYISMIFIGSQYPGCSKYVPLSISLCKTLCSGQHCTGDKRPNADNLMVASLNYFLFHLLVSIPCDHQAQTKPIGTLIEFLLRRIILAISSGGNFHTSSLIMASRSQLRMLTTCQWIQSRNPAASF